MQEYQLELPQPAEFTLTPIHSAEMAGWVAFQERNSIATALQTKIAQERQSYEWDWLDDKTFSEKRFGNNTEVYREVWKHILGGLKKSDAVTHYREMNGLVEHESEAAAAVKAFDRSIYRAVKAVSMTEQQRNEFMSNYGEKDYELVGIAMDVVGQYHKAVEAGIEFDEDGNALNAEFELKHPPQTNFFLAAPKLRHVDYLDSKEIKGLARRFGNITNAETAKRQMKSDLSGLAEITRKAA